MKRVTNNECRWAASRIIVEQWPGISQNSSRVEMAWIFKSDEKGLSRHTHRRQVQKACELRLNGLPVYGWRLKAIVGRLLSSRGECCGHFGRRYVLIGAYSVKRKE